MHFTFYLGDSSRKGLNLQFNSNVKSGLRVPLGTIIYGINFRIMRAEFKMLVVIVDEVSFDEMSRPKRRLPHTDKN